MKARPLTAVLAAAASLLGLVALLTLGTGPHSGLRGLLAAVTLQVPYWGLAPWLGVSGVTIWMSAVVAAAFPEDRFAWTWTGVAVLACFAFTFPVAGGLAIPLAVPLIVGATVGSRALGSGRGTGYAARAALGVTFVGSLVGSDVLGLLVGKVPAGASTVAVIGGAGFLDALFVAPVLATSWVAAFGALRDRLWGSEGSPSRGPLMHRTTGETLAWTGLGMVAAVPAWVLHLAS